MRTYDKGLQGEEAALKYLKKRGMKPVDSRVRLGRGEIDLIMREDDCTVFVEVKYRPMGQ
ncbi:MAG: YraN family protein, partial [Clostridia bacterium]|nr:YraN family protein [Clostridia bacterium]